jgi:hypothetical protein
MGEKTEAGVIVYQTAAAVIRGGKIDRYSGLEQASADSFWFR